MSSAEAAAPGAAETTAPFRADGRSPGRRHSVAVIAGDGIGPEVVPVAVDAVDRVGSARGFAVEWTHYPWGSQYHRDHGRMMPADALGQLAQHDAVFFGAVGAPDIPDAVTLWGLLVPIRRGFDQYVNLRPVRHVPGVWSPLSEPDGLDLVIVRENVEGEYSQVGGRFGSGSREAAVQESVFTRSGVERVATYAVELAARRRGQLTSATKSNGIIHTMPFWDEVVAAVADRRPEVELRSMLVDALAAALVSRPQRFDVIVASNLFGDILSDLTAALAGSIGLAASANLNPEKNFPSMFEPVHGSAPDIAGRSLANPLGQVRAGAMMLEHLGEAQAAQDLDGAVDALLREGPHTADLGGTATTAETAEALLQRLPATIGAG
jgi:tartrate dehydrogenase/decarboxylase/D-malate dehydrogenase